MCDADYTITAFAMNMPACMNDRSAFRAGKFDELIGTLPDPYYIVGDAAYPSGDKVMVPWPGTGLPPNKDAFNFYQSQSRMPIEQTFGMMVSVFSINPPSGLPRTHLE